MVRGIATASRSRTCWGRSAFLQRGHGGPWRCDLEQWAREVCIFPPSFNGATVVRGVATAVCPSCTSLASTLQRGHGAPWRCDAWLCRSPPGWPPPFNGATVVRGVATSTCPAPRPRQSTFNGATVVRGVATGVEVELAVLVPGPSTGPRWSVALRRRPARPRPGLPFNGATVVRGVATPLIGTRIRLPTPVPTP